MKFPIWLLFGLGCGPQLAPAPSTQGASFVAGPSPAGSSSQGPTGPAGKDAQSSGSRIKATYFVGADGSRQFKAMHDTLLDRDVYPAKLTDGKLHWLAQVARANCSSYFSNAGCTNRICAGSCVGTEGAWSDATQCNGETPTTHVVTLGAKLSDNATIYAGTAGSCAATTTGTDGYYYSMGPEISPTAYVEVAVISD